MLNYPGVMRHAIPLTFVALLSSTPVSFGGLPTAVDLIASNQMLVSTPTTEFFKKDVQESEVYQSAATKKEIKHVVSQFYNLKDNLLISNSIFAEWLGIKPRTLYNWLKAPAQTRNSEEISRRLTNIQSLYDDMDVEHRSILYKLAFSKTFGNLALGEALKNGALASELLKLYDESYDAFDWYSKSYTKITDYK